MLLAVEPEIFINDISTLNPTIVNRIEKPRSLEDLQKIVQTAIAQNLTISIAGARHSQGGQIAKKGGIVIDMRAYNKILDLDEKNKILSVQSGVTWEQVQNFLNKRGLAVKVQQSSNVFTVGGSLGSNIHGRDPRFGTIIETVKGFHLLNAEGKLIYVSRTTNPKLFSLVIGGYGLFGIVTDVDLEVTNNDILKKETVIMPCTEYPAFVKANILNNGKIQLHYARPNITLKNLFKECSVTSFSKVARNQEQLNKLDKEKMVATTKWLFNLSRKFEAGKKFRWYLQEHIFDSPSTSEVLSRNNAMRPPFQFLDYYSKYDTDILQEYFIPLSKSASFMQALKELLLKEKVNILSVTLRVVPVSDEAFLAYDNGTEPKIAFVLYLNHKKSDAEIEKVTKWTRKIVDMALAHGGTYYLTYSLYPTKEQLNRAYPNFDVFVKLKKSYDPNGLFDSKFYDYYH